MKIPFGYKRNGKLVWRECGRNGCYCNDCEKNKVHIAPYENVIIDFKDYEKHKYIFNSYSYYRLRYKEEVALDAHRIYYLYWIKNIGFAYMVKSSGLRRQLYQNLYPILRLRGIFPRCTNYNLDLCICL